jgi:hypothetical protein
MVLVGMLMAAMDPIKDGLGLHTQVLVQWVVAVQEVRSKARERVETLAKVSMYFVVEP